MNKFFAKRQGGHASVREDKRAWELKLLQKAGEISELEEQVKIELLPAAPEKGYPLALRMFVDFRYKDREGNVVWEDSKGRATRDWKIRQRLAKQLLNIDVREV